MKQQEQMKKKAMHTHTHEHRKYVGLRAQINRLDLLALYTQFVHFIAISRHRRFCTLLDSLLIIVELFFSHFVRIIRLAILFVVLIFPPFFLFFFYFIVVCLFETIFLFSHHQNGITVYNSFYCTIKWEFSQTCFELIYKWIFGVTFLLQK